MASTETRPSFRLPWSAGAGESDEPSENPIEASIESGDMHDSEETQTPPMIDTVDAAPAVAQPEPPPAVPVRRATKFMAELSHAMQAAAEHARNETMERFEAEAKAVVEEIRSSATSDVADLRRKADDDVAAIREWSKAEIARVREKTEARVAARKTGLDNEMDAHTAAIEARAERVSAVVAAFETEMSAFFERLNAEEDPTRIATMAETMPDPPSLEDVVASIVAASAAPATAPEPIAATTESPEAAAGPEATLAAPAAIDAPEIDFAAAEAEALSFDGDLATLADDEDGNSPGSADEGNGESGAEPLATFDAATSSSETVSTTRVVVTGLVSVASIANFKRSLARIGGIWSIGVSSGPNAEFIFTVSHNGELPLAGEIASLPGFETQITGESDTEILVSAQDRDAAE